MEKLSIGQLAKRANVNIQTIRYYERKGLMPEPSRMPNRYRQYGSEEIARLRFIKNAQDLGFTLKKISELLCLRVDHDTTCAEVRERAEAKIAEIEEKILSLQGIKRALTRLVEACKGKGPTGECPILEALDSENT